MAKGEKKNGAVREYRQSDERASITVSVSYDRVDRPREKQTIEMRSNNLGPGGGGGGDEVLGTMAIGTGGRKRTNQNIVIEASIEVGGQPAQTLTLGVAQFEALVGAVRKVVPRDRRTLGGPPYGYGDDLPGDPPYDLPGDMIG